MDPRAFETHRWEHVAYVREGVGGFPLLLIHGWPETKRIWWRNIGPLAEAGFEVIAPDLRGFGESGLAPDGHYDIVTQARALNALVRDELGHQHCVVAGGDFGGVVAQDLSLRFEGLVERLVLFNTIPPRLPDEYAAAGLADETPREARMAADYFLRQGNDADGLAAELDTQEKRRRYVAEMYGPRFWAAPGRFSPDEVDFMTEPFGDAEHFRASIALYEYATRTRQWPERPLLTERNPTPALLLYGPEDHVIPADYPRRLEIAFPEHVGTFVVPEAGHFLQWERAELLNPAIRYFCLDLLGELATR
jgi:pimeloyl-ACP methyl ester carboxylesterase